MIRIYDTLQRQKAPLEPLEPGKLSIYVCGPTTYDYCHVGHARCYVAFDVIVRFLRAAGFHVKYVRNITDVDDKIIARAKEAGEEPLALSARFTEEFWRDMDALGNVRPDVEPKVSEHLAEIETLIQKLVARGHAYQAAGDVYFQVDTFAAYGRLSGRDTDELRAGARVEVNERKRNPLDFALWKEAKPGEIAWSSPWGTGRPGWHAECSAMSHRYLGERFDLHGGGMDLVFPHHENELAQSRAADGEGTFARYWLHNGFINVRTEEQGGEEKMSKSLGNFFTIREVCRRHDPEALRLFLLGTHYRKPISFEIARSGEAVSFPGLEEAEARLAYAYATLARLDELLSTGKSAGPGEVLPPVDTFGERFTEALSDDFNTAQALGLTSELLSLANKLLDQPKSAPKDVRRRTLERLREEVGRVSSVLGIWAQAPTVFLARRREKLCAARGIDPAQIEARIGERKAARQGGDYARADEIRQELAESGVELMDGPSGTTWSVSDKPS
ncbi:MAG: cysteine--tRNA ligase [Deltaproteobacteria bacterium]|nr:cysteine--tRNA ligase [Deltaproteobacteria bacterium]